jgi:hypothetical protein
VLLLFALLLRVVVRADVRTAAAAAVACCVQHRSWMTSYQAYSQLLLLHAPH